MNNVVLQAKHITKRFPGLIANDDINLELCQKEILAIIGENGAGKSTFCKILTGIYSPDEGEILLDGAKVSFRNTKDSMSAGISMVYQERNLVPMLNGAQNICLGANAARQFFLNDKQIMQESMKIRERLSISVPLDCPIEKLGAGEQQLIEIMRALYSRPKVLILDEPTASLGEGEIEPFLAFIKTMTRELDVAVIFISHKIEEVFEIADRIAVFTDGRSVLAAPKTELTQEDCINAMLRNTTLATLRVSDAPRPDDCKPVFSIQGVGYSGKTCKLNLKGYSGDVIGYYGLVGSGRTEFVESIMGLRKATLENFVLDGEPIESATPQSMIAKGVILTPEIRANGIFPSLSLIDNVSNLFLKKELAKKMGFVDRKKSRGFTEEVLRVNNVKYSSENQAIKELSGGNVQKVIIGRSCKVENIKVLILDEPTTGMDVGAKHEVYLTVRRLAEKEGLCIVFISSELEELLAVCNCISVFSRGDAVKTFDRKEFNKKIILETAIRGRTNEQDS